MVPQPSGTVTLVFTDIEGSTRLLEGLGAEGYRSELGRHRMAVRETFGRNGGYEVDNQGDAFFYAFASAADAVSASEEAIAVLAKGPIRIRVGIHTGEPTLDPPKYVGIDVHRAARIMACAHGGQVVISQTTRDLLEHTDGLRDLGEHRLKDLSAPVRLYQLGDGDFPPLRSLYRTNLPVPATPFLGRERELSELTALLARDDLRLLTLTGPGGTGKTRLALQAAAESADRFPEGVWWVPLAPLREPALVLSAVAQALETAEEPGRRISETLVDRFAGKRLLLVLDNAEHLLPQVAEAIAALRDIGTPQVLVTSRERMQLGGEQLYPVPTLTDDDAAAMFSARASRLDPGFTPTPAVATLCRRLDNLPLAIELAAARTTLFTPEQLLDRLAGRLDLLRGDRDTDPRQQTLRATIDWSYQLLAPDEQRVYRALSVFAGGCTLEAAEHICDADPDALQSLLDKSLLRRRDAETGPRFWMLESLREHAFELLEASAEADQVRARHARWSVALAEQADREQRSLLRDAWLDRLALEENNFRAAIEWAIDGGHHTELARLAASLSMTWVWRGDFEEVDRWLHLALDRKIADDEPLRARLLMVAGFARVMQTDLAGGRAALEEALAICQALGDIEGAGFCLNGLGLAAANGDDLERARGLWEECRELARGHELEDRLAIATLNLGAVALRKGRLEEARALADEALHAFAEAGSPLLANALLVLGEVARLSGRYGDAERLTREGLEACLRRKGRLIGARTLVSLASLAAIRGDARRGALLLGAGEALDSRTPSADMTERRCEVLAELRRQLPEPELEQLLAEGRAMRFEEAARLALEPS